MSDWTYHAQDALTGAWIDRDLQLRDVEIVDQLTGHCSMRATIAPENGAGLLEEFGTFVYAEKFDTIRFGGYLHEATVSDDGQQVDLDIRSFTAFAEGQPYNGKFRLWSADPLDCLREVWDFIQSRGRSDLGFVVDADTSGVAISDPEPPDRPKRADVTYPAGSPHGTAGNSWPRPPKPRRMKKRKPVKRKRRPGEADTHWANYLAWYEDRLEAWQAKRQVLRRDRLPEWRAWKKRLRNMRAAWEDDYGDKEPYKLSWWDATDCGQEAARLAQECPFDWRERHAWTDGTKATVNHRLQLGYPTIGVDHAGLVLVPGEQLTTNPTQIRAGDRYANTILALGAGEGRKTRRVTVEVDDGRLRRTRVYTAKKVKREKRLAAMARDERSYRRLLRNIEEIDVWDTDGLLGDLRLGDTVDVQAHQGALSGTTDHKIIGRRYRPDEDDHLKLQLVRAERTSAE